MIPAISCATSLQTPFTIRPESVRCPKPLKPQRQSMVLRLAGPFALSLPSPGTVSQARGPNSPSGISGRPLNSIATSCRKSEATQVRLAAGSWPRRFPGRMFLLWETWNVVSRNSIDEALRHATLQVRQDDNCDIVLPVHSKSGLSTPERHVAGMFGSGKYRPAESPSTVLSVVEDAVRLCCNECSNRTGHDAAQLHCHQHKQYFA